MKKNIISLIKNLKWEIVKNALDMMKVRHLSIKQEINLINVRQNFIILI